MNARRDTARTEPLPPLAILAGGLGTRIAAVTQDRLPKVMIEVADEPFVVHQLRLVAAKGIRDVVLCTGFLGEQIEVLVGDGARFGCRVRYSSDGDRQLGTGGALKQALPLLGERFFVIYGDSYLDVDFAVVFRAFEAGGLPALMTVFRNAGRWDTSNVEFAGGLVRRYDKDEKTPAMAYIDYGLSVMSASAFTSRPAGVKFDLAEIQRALSLRGQLGGYEITERFYEIGSQAGLAETDEHLRRRLGRPPRNPNPSAPEPTAP